MGGLKTGPGGRRWKIPWPRVSSPDSTFLGTVGEDWSNLVTATHLNKSLSSVLHLGVD